MLYQFTLRSHEYICCRLQKVGWIFTQSTAERDWIMDSEEIQQMAAMQVGTL